MRPTKRHALRRLRRERQRQAAITRQQDAFDDYCYRHRHPYGFAMPRRVVRAMKRWPQGEPT